MILFSGHGSMILITNAIYTYIIADIIAIHTKYQYMVPKFNILWFMHATNVCKIVSPLWTLLITCLCLITTVLHSS